jgi:hypothetical protein
MFADEPQEVTFWVSKGHILSAERPPFGVQLAAFCNALVFRQIGNGEDKIIFSAVFPPALGII